MFDSRCVCDRATHLHPGQVDASRPRSRDGRRSPSPKHRPFPAFFSPAADPRPGYSSMEEHNDAESRTPGLHTGSNAEVCVGRAGTWSKWMVGSRCVGCRRWPPLQKMTRTHQALSFTECWEEKGKTGSQQRTLEADIVTASQNGCCCSSEINTLWSHCLLLLNGNKKESYKLL